MGSTGIDYLSGILERSPGKHLAPLKRCKRINAKPKGFQRVLNMVSDMLEDKVVEPILVSTDQAYEDDVATEYSHIGTELVTCS